MKIVQWVGVGLGLSLNVNTTLSFVIRFFPSMHITGAAGLMMY